jgi:23S rRNA (cytidine1920-2'-O)/16S rRNA (cytidine1409-2'-O)-methyltransferase
VRRRLDTELVRRGLLPSRSSANEAIAAGRVTVRGAPAATAARQVAIDDPIAVAGPTPRFVSRGGDKLDAALEAFRVPVAGRRVLDAGASTGGFTDCLLQRCAAHVYAVDVGHGQLAWQIRTDRRVTVIERTNVRHLEPGALGGPVPVAVADLSFISLLTVASALVRCTTADAQLVLLVKPQFEAGAGRVGKGGVVRDPDVHADVLTTIAAGLERAGITLVAAVASPLRGAEGNREFLVHGCRAGGERLTHSELVAVARSR